MMNWLAHILLAGGGADHQVGGVLADLVGMNTVRTLPDGLREGIALHHAIDAFSDSHPSVSASNRRLTAAGIGLRPAAAAIAVDMLYDHLLARTWARRCPAASLEAFAENFYRTAAARETLIPPGVRRVFHFMRAGNWLVSYRELGEIRRALEGIRGRLSPRAAALCPLALAADVFAREPDAFASDFEAFWPHVAERAAAFLADVNR